MQKKVLGILSIVFVIIAGVSIISLGNSYELFNFLRELRDESQEFSKNIDKVVGKPIDAKIFDKDYLVLDYVTGLHQPTTMKFFENNLLVLEKNTGKILSINNAQINQIPIFDFSVSSSGEQGLLGIETVDSKIFIFVTESTKDGGTSIGNKIYQLDWNGKNFSNPILLKELPGYSLAHNGGVMTVDKSGDVYAVIGDQTMTGSSLENYRILQNRNYGDVDDTSVIFKISDPAQEFNDKNLNLSNYYAIGIRNSFGLAIDPLTGFMWDTENGPENFDEINLVFPKFNSGWVNIMGPASESQLTNLSNFENFKYSDPEFSWEDTVSPTALIFPYSKNFPKYDNHLFVADCKGNIYKFKLNSNRDGFIFETSHLKDLVLNSIVDENGQSINESDDEILFGTGFGCITDMEFGPDGNLYVTSISDNSIYKILPK